MRYRIAAIALALLLATTAAATVSLFAYVPDECADGIDNDGDGNTDLADSNCVAAFDRSEGGQTLTYLDPTLYHWYLANTAIWTPTNVVDYLDGKPGKYLAIDYRDTPGSGTFAQIAAAVPGWRAALATAGETLRLAFFFQPYVAIAAGEEDNAANDGTLGALGCVAGQAHYCTADHSIPCTAATVATDCAGLSPATCDTTPADVNSTCNLWRYSSDTNQWQDPWPVGLDACPGASGTNCCEHPNVCSSPNGDMHVRHSESTRWSSDMIERVTLDEWNAARVRFEWLDFCTAASDRVGTTQHIDGFPWQGKLCSMVGRCWQGPNHGASCTADSECAGSGGVDKDWDPRAPFCSAPMLYGLADSVRKGQPTGIRPYLTFRNPATRSWVAWMAQMTLEDAGVALDDDVAFLLVYKTPEIVPLRGVYAWPEGAASHCWMPDTTSWGLFRTEVTAYAGSSCDGGPMMLYPQTAAEIVQYQNETTLEIRNRLTAAGYTNFKLATFERPSAIVQVAGTWIQDAYKYVSDAILKDPHYVGNGNNQYGYTPSVGMCGNGELEGSEVCDDGDTVVGTCAYGDTSSYEQTCADDCSGFVDCASPTWCGDTFMNGPEDCDDGNAVLEPCNYGEQTCQQCGGAESVNVTLSTALVPNHSWQMAGIEIRSDFDLATSVDASVYVTGTGTVTTPPLTTSTAGDLLVAFVASGSSIAGQQATVSGGGLDWTMRARSNQSGGSVEIWEARSVASVTNEAITATPVLSGFSTMLAVYAFQDDNGSGARTTASGTGTQPAVALNVQTAGSWTWAVGIDRDGGARTVATGQTLQREYLPVSPLQEGFWVQSTATPESKDNCALTTVTGTWCGDGLLNGSEQCDDGGTTAGDGCTATCTIETAECSDGVDNDGDTFTDYPADSGCTDANDTSEAAPVVSDWVGAWSFSEALDSTTALDSSGSGYTGALVPSATHTANGHSGNGLEVNGASGYVSLGAIDPFPASAMTLMAWINADDYGVSDARIVSKSTSSAESDHTWMLSTISSSGSKLRMRLRTGSTTTTLIATSGTMTAGTWYHVAATYDGANMKLYLDGVLVGSAAKTGTIAQNAAANVGIGSNPGSPSQTFDGRIDEVKFFARALTAEELATEAGIVITPPVAACNDSIDNDSDGLTDLADAGCTSASDTSEREAGGAACDDGIDNDSDLLTDYPLDTGCTSRADTSEREATGAACDDGADNDGDGATDYPSDPGCTSVADTSERQVGGAQCDDTVDNDGVNGTDYPADTVGCTGPSDTIEAVPPVSDWPAEDGSDVGINDPQCLALYGKTPTQIANTACSGISGGVVAADTALSACHLTSSIDLNGDNITLDCVKWDTGVAPFGTRCVGSSGCANLTIRRTTATGNNGVLAQGSQEALVKLTTYSGHALKTALIEDNDLSLADVLIQFGSGPDSRVATYPSESYAVVVRHNRLHHISQAAGAHTDGITLFESVFGVLFEYNLIDATGTDPAYNWGSSVQLQTSTANSGNFVFDHNHIITDASGVALNFGPATSGYCPSPVYWTNNKVDLNSPGLFAYSRSCGTGTPPGCPANTTIECPSLGSDASHVCTGNTFENGSPQACSSDGL